MAADRLRPSSASHARLGSNLAPRSWEAVRKVEREIAANRIELALKKVSILMVCRMEWGREEIGGWEDRQVLCSGGRGQSGEPGVQTWKVDPRSVVAVGEKYGA